MSTNEVIKMELVAEGGSTLSVLTDLIQQRAHLLNQTTEQSVRATAINVLKSLRAATRKSKGNIAVVQNLTGELQCEVKECPNMRVGVHMVGGIRKFCVRDGGGKSIVDMKPWFLCSPDILKYAKIFKVTLSEDRTKAWQNPKPFPISKGYCVATDIEVVMDKVKKNFAGRIQKHAGLHKDAWTQAMTFIAGRRQAINAKTLQGVVSQNVHVNQEGKSNGIIGGSGEFYITISNEMTASISSLKNGMSSVEESIMRAANATVGIVNSFLDKHSNDFFSTKTRLEVPFNEGDFI